ncbi:MAG: hypothetical protein ACKPGI_04470 [Verrucomicrobiota bacterium]
MKLTRVSPLSVLVALALLSANGCSKPPAEDPSVIKAVDNLPGSKEVWAAVDKKDYEGVMTALGKVREKVTTEDQNTQYMILAYKVRERLTETAPNDPKAMEVVSLLRGLTTGR